LSYFLHSVTKDFAREVKTVVLAPYHDRARKAPAKLRAEFAMVKAKIENGTIIPATRSQV
jgi:hypothetical protein